MALSPAKPLGSSAIGWQMGQAKKKRIPQEFSSGSHPKVAHNTFLPTDLNSVTWSRKQAGEGSLAVCLGGKVTVFW